MHFARQDRHFFPASIIVAAAQPHGVQRWAIWWQNIR